MAKVPFKSAQVVQEVVCRCLSSVKQLFRSCTLDNGKEFAQHEQISQILEGESVFRPSLLILGTRYNREHERIDPAVFSKGL